MKKAILWILALLVLCGCTAAALEAESAAPESTVPPVTEPVAETQAPPDPLARLQLVLPQNLTASAGHPSVSLAPEFSGLDPDAAVDCTLTLTRDGQTVYENPDLCLTPDTRLRITVDFPFTRYLSADTSLLRLELRAGDRVFATTSRVRLENWSDEIYSAGLDDPLPYAIDVLRSQNVVIVYGKDETGEYTMPVKVFLCSTGRATPSGTYTLGSKYQWGALFGGVWGQYVSRITGNILFHSVPYHRKAKDSLETEEYNKLGTAASMGCVRLPVRDCKWIFDYCPKGTRVRIYDTASLPVPRPTADTLPLDDPKSGWDPTDPDPENPWKEAPPCQPNDYSTTIPTSVALPQ